MSLKEARRITILEKLQNKELKQKQAAKLLGLSTRQVRRIVGEYRLKGVMGITHKLRGTVGNRQANQEIVDEALKIVTKNYSDFTITHAHEKLKEMHDFPYSRETLRLAMVEVGIHKPKQQRPIVLHGIRERRKREGELVQIDGSPHDWFEGRGEYCNLLVFIDDATGKLMELLFVTHESTLGYMKGLKHYLERHGKPLSLYSDRHSIFKINSNKGGSATPMDEVGLTQFGRACQELSIELIFANSPQAKGRVERVNQTLQDRLVKEMRLKGINEMEEANQYLPEFMADFNKRFGVAPTSPLNAHRPLDKGVNLEEILVEKETRVVSKQLTISYQNQLIQLKPKTGSGRILIRQKVVVVHDIKGEMRIRYQHQDLPYTTSPTTKHRHIKNSKTLNRAVDKLTHYSPEYEEPWHLFTPIPAERQLTAAT